MRREKREQNSSFRSENPCCYTFFSFCRSSLVRMRRGGRRRFCPNIPFCSQLFSIQVIHSAPQWMRFCRLQVDSRFFCYTSFRVSVCDVCVCIFVWVRDAWCCEKEEVGVYFSHFSFHKKHASQSQASVVLTMQYLRVYVWFCMIPCLFNAEPKVSFHSLAFIFIIISSTHHWLFLIFLFSPCFGGENSGRTLISWKLLLTLLLLVVSSRCVFVLSSDEEEEGV